MSNTQSFRTDNWWVSPFNYVEEVRKQFPDLPARVQIHDVTLRDGEQTPGVVFRTEEKVRIAGMLDEAGVERIEVALPAVSAEDVAAVKAVVAAKLKAEIYVLSRATEKDIDLAVACGVDGIILEMPVGAPRLDYQFKSWSRDDVIERTQHALQYAKKQNLKVVVFPMDCTRAEPPFFKRFLESIAKGPLPEAVALVDTTGCLLPQAAMHMVGLIRQITGVRAEVHTHNDFGLGVSTSVAAVAAGASVVHTSVTGLGERTGNTPLEVVAVALKSLYNVEMNIRFDKLTNLGRTVAELAGIRMPVSQPVIGERAFTRESGMGLNLIHEQPLALFALNPPFVGQKPGYVLGKKSGTASVEMKLAELGLGTLDEERTLEVLKRVKQSGIEKKALVTDEEFRRIVQDVETGE